MTQQLKNPVRTKPLPSTSTDVLHEEDGHVSETTSNDKHESEDDEERVDDEDEDFGSEPSWKANAVRSTSALADGNISVRSPPRRRLVRKKLAHKDIVPLSPSKPSRFDIEQRRPEYQDAILNGIRSACRHTFTYIMSLGEIFFRCIRFPLAYIMVALAIFMAIGFMIGYASQTLSRAIQPACIIPGISRLSLCNPSGPAAATHRNTTPKWADYSTLMNIQSKSFEQLLDESAGGSGLSLEIKKAEMATTDLMARVRVSDLNARESLARSLSEFVLDAKKTGRGLQKLTSKVGGAVDNIMAVNDYALQAIESARAKELSQWSLQSLVPWQAPRKRIDAVVMRTFNEAMSTLSVNMERLIVEAEHNLHNLNDLEERLATLHEIIAREDTSILSARADLLEDLWSRLGGNRKSLRNFDDHLALLKGLANYRKEALVHVVAALQTLRAMSEDMEDMRERVVAPDLIGKTVPAEVHMKSIQMGLDRLREGRTRAKKLEEDAVRRVLLVDN